MNNRHPWADLSLSAHLNRSKELEGGALIALLSALNYSNTYKTYAPMQNSFYGAYDLQHDQSVYLRNTTDRQYAHNARLGAMLNLTFVPAKGWDAMSGRIYSISWVQTAILNAMVITRRAI